MSETFTPPTPPKEWIKYVGSLGGKSKSAKKVEAARNNLKKASAKNPKHQKKKLDKLVGNGIIES